MNKEEFKKLLDDASEAYYNDGKLLMSDEKFDQLVIEYEMKFGEKYSTMTSPRVQTATTEHSIDGVVGTLNKANTLEEVNDWLKDIFPLGEKCTFRISTKYDGNSISIEYMDGVVQKALTRGKDGAGVDLTGYFKNRTITDTRHLAVRYEAIMDYPTFEKICEERGKSYANPRSLIAGLFRDLDGVKYGDDISLVPLSYKLADGYQHYLFDEIDDLNKMHRDWDDIVEYENYIYLTGDLDHIIGSIESFYNHILEIRPNLDYMIDGVVIEVISSKLRKDLGYSGTSPKYAIALKFPYMEKESTITNIEWDMSTSGSRRLTPIAVYEPVIFSGAVQERTSLANYKRYKELEPIGIGTKILVQYRNDVLSYVEKLDILENEAVNHIPSINECPICGGDVYPNEAETYLYCSNEECPSIYIGKLNKYVNEVGMLGIEYETLSKLYELGLVDRPLGLYNLNVKYLIKNGFGEKTSENIINIIKNNEPFDYQVLSGLGIEGIGSRKAKDIIDHIPWAKLVDKEYLLSEEFNNDIDKVPGVGKKLKDRLYDYLTLMNPELIMLTTASNMKFSPKKQLVDNPLRFVITGDVYGYKDRSELKQKLESIGHRVTSSVSGKTDYLICNDSSSGTSKVKKATELNVPIITEEELLDIVNIQ